MSRIASTLLEGEAQFKKPVETARKPRHRVGMKRTPLRRISPKKKNWRDLYLICLRFLIGLDPMCRRCRSRYANQGHHPLQQQGALILIFFPVCTLCHMEIECNKNKSREEGWVLYPIRLSSPD